MSDKLPILRGLDSLKKEAKRWLQALRGGVPDARARFERAISRPPASPTLRDVQHALAREHGFAGWPDLKRQMTAYSEQRARSVGRFDEMADALLDAYRSGSPVAMERHWALTWHRRNWQTMRSYVQLDLGRQAGSANLNDDITLDDARFLIAREHGFDDWDALVRFCGESAVKPSNMTDKPVRVLDPTTSEDESRAWRSRDWNAVIDRLKGGQADGVNAEGIMTDAMLADLSEIEHVTELKLGGSKGVTDAGIAHLARLPHIRRLDLSGTSITDQGLGVLRALPSLESLSLAWTRVTDRGMPSLSQCDQLCELSLQGTATGDGAIRALAGKARLRQLRTGNGVTDAGLEGLHDIPIFKRWHGGEPEMGLTSYDAGPNYLLLRGSFGDRGIVKLEGPDGLFALNLDASELGLTAAALAPLVGLPNLGWLAYDATDDAMPYIARMPKLRFLGCQDTTAGDEGFVALSQSQSIEYIWGRRCHNLRTRGFASLARMPALRGLSVSCKNVGDAGVGELPKFEALRELMPMDVPDDGYRHIGLCEGLESLILMYCRETGDLATEHIVRLPRLANYFASYTRITDRTPELLSQITSLERITFDGCAGVTNVGISHLGRLPRLRELRVSGRNVTGEAAIGFPERVQVHIST